MLGSDTDRDWEQFGRDDPYYGVLLESRYRREQLTPAALEDFFRTGREHVERIFTVITAELDAGFAPKRALEFGCGVGRIVVALSPRCERVVGADVSEAMLREAGENCARRGATNVDLVRCDDSLSSLTGTFDLVHTFIVLQHIDPARGQRLLEGLVDRIAEGGVGVFHLTYANDLGPRQRFIRWARQSFRPVRYLLNLRHGRPAAQPFMQMNRYDLNRVMRTLQDRGCHACALRFTNHFDHRGVVVFTRKMRLESL